MTSKLREFLNPGAGFLFDGGGTFQDGVWNFTGTNPIQINGVPISDSNTSTIGTLTVLTQLWSNGNSYVANLDCPQAVFGTITGANSISMTDGSATNCFVVGGTSCAAGNAMTVVGNMRVQGDFWVDGSITTINTNSMVTDRWTLVNAGTGPAMLINQLGVQPVLDVQRSSSSVIYVGPLGNVTVGSNNETANISLFVDRTDSMRVPAGTTGQSGTGIDGCMRYDTSVNKFVGKVSGSWTAFTMAGGSDFVQAGQSFTGANNNEAAFMAITGSTVAIQSSPDVLIDSGGYGLLVSSLFSNAATVVGNGGPFTVENGATTYFNVSTSGTVSSGVNRLGGDTTNFATPGTTPYYNAAQTQMGCFSANNASVPAMNAVPFTVTFPQVFSGTPLVTLTLSYTDAPNVNVFFSSFTTDVTTTGFTAYVANPSSVSTGNAALNVHWRADGV